VGAGDKTRIIDVLRQVCSTLPAMEVLEHEEGSDDSSDEEKDQENELE
jgi:hypothetical protein